MKGPIQYIDFDTTLLTSHKLVFEMGSNDIILPERSFRIGTIEGEYRQYKDSYCVFTLINKIIGNGHFQDFIEWFEYLCSREEKNFIVMECQPRLFRHLTTKRGFISLNEAEGTVIKIFNQSLYQHLINYGNPVLESKTGAFKFK